MAIKQAVFVQSEKLLSAFCLIYYIGLFVLRICSNT